MGLGEPAVPGAPQAEAAHRLGQRALNALAQRVERPVAGGRLPRPCRDQRLVLITRMQLELAPPFGPGRFGTLRPGLAGPTAAGD